MEIKAEAKWEGKACTKLTGARADEVWPLLQDFFNLDKWFPNLTTCRGIEGVNGQPGCVRYCAGFSIPNKGSDEETVSWSTERLVSMDEMERSFSYEIVDSNIGFKSYVSTMKVLPWNSNHQNGCVIEWSFLVDPVQGWNLKDLVSKFDSGLQRMANTIVEALRCPSQEI
ncbi:hypothetical protein HHK36_014193 [Tetracentron sinense]|uniref:Lachrymatory-factor synthase n=1 Tax=Tetracentron sinense TaxID=13715 RepID=A0A834Z7R3_TETSI|nr:hypothetical protein HHK36_014193 [Tetracentron sinense]